MNTDRTPTFYMANLGAEVSRALSARERGDAKITEEAIARGLLIIDKVLSFEEMKPRASEINILKNLLESISERDFSESESRNFKNYFYPFALRVTM